MVIGTWQQGLYGALILPKMKGNRGGTPRKEQTNLPREVKAGPSRVAFSIGIQGQCSSESKITKTPALVNGDRGKTGRAQWTWTWGTGLGSQD